MSAAELSQIVSFFAGTVSAGAFALAASMRFT